MAIVGIAIAVFVLRTSSGLVLGIEERALEPVRIILGGDLYLKSPEFVLVEEMPGSYNFVTGDEKGEFFVETQEMEKRLKEIGITTTYPVLSVKCLLPQQDMDFNIIMGRNIENDITFFHIDQSVQGRYFTEDDKGRSVAVVDASSEMWGNAHVKIGDSLSVLLPEVQRGDNRLILDFGSGTVEDFEIIGLYSGGIMGTDAIWVPEETLRKLTHIDEEATYVAVITESQSDTTEFETKIKQNNLSVLTIYDMMEALSRDFGEFKQFIRTIVFITYGVSALILVNIMLAAVGERQHEIGILKSIGAKSTDITILIVCESALLGLIGGLLGFFSGSFTAAVFSGKLFFDLETIITDIVIVVIICSIAGVYPAVKASRIPAMEVLRYE
ncbi:MAG: ABC transporter permease [Theionarchaea archaeon]|nr:MAG: hypothetical protein AYK18_05290 [Theionarchaea archaeon DG-70]MBU7011887.1 ABC transporter permease [Theionarchaea archaeon]